MTESQDKCDEKQPALMQRIEHVSRDSNWAELEYYSYTFPLDSAS